MTPGSQFPAFTERIARIIGASFGLPYEFVLLDFSMGSFSSSRAALLQTYRTFEGWQRWLIGGMLQPIWNWRIAKAIKAGDLPPAPVDARGVSEWYKVRWQRPEFGWVDPQSENQGHILAINAGASTLSEWCGKRGRDAEDVLHEKGADITTAIKVAESINAAHGTNLTWRDLIVTNMPGQVVNQPTDKKQDDASKPKDKEDKPDEN
jgi:capsid protein